MVFVPAGEFLMGSAEADSDADEDEKPQRRVYLDAYWIDKYEVTNEQYGKFLAWIMQSKDYSKCHPDEPANRDHTPGCWTSANLNGPKQPVEGVDWWDAYAYAAWAGKRLPTEAEWEKAARGTGGWKYPWGNEWDGSKCNTSDGGPGVTTPVGSYRGNVSPYGCHDMAGNVWEWCADWYDEGYYGTGPVRNPTGPESGSVRVLRGGSWLRTEGRAVREPLQARPRGRVLHQRLSLCLSSVVTLYALAVATLYFRHLYSG
jgi:formylglycine-generating enzyme required for sulfatase activity